jgi:hypothetical protein
MATESSSSSRSRWRSTNEESEGRLRDARKPSERPVSTSTSSAETTSVSDPSKARSKSNSKSTLESPTRGRKTEDGHRARSISENRTRSRSPIPGSRSDEARRGEHERALKGKRDYLEVPSSDGGSSQVPRLDPDPDPERNPREARSTSKSKTEAERAGDTGGSTEKRKGRTGRMRSAEDEEARRDRRAARALAEAKKHGGVEDENRGEKTSRDKEMEAEKDHSSRRRGSGPEEKSALKGDSRRDMIEGDGDDAEEKERRARRARHEARARAQVSTDTVEGVRMSSITDVDIQRRASATHRDRSDRSKHEAERAVGVRSRSRRLDPDMAEKVSSAKWLREVCLDLPFGPDVPAVSDHSPGRPSVLSE